MRTDIRKLLVKVAPEIEADGPIGPGMMFKTIVPMGKEIGAAIAHAPMQSRSSSGLPPTKRPVSARWLASCWARWARSRRRVSWTRGIGWRRMNGGKCAKLSPTLLTIRWGPRSGVCLRDDVEMGSRSGRECAPCADQRADASRYSPAAQGHRADEGTATRRQRVRPQNVVFCLQQIAKVKHPILGAGNADNPDMMLATLREWSADTDWRAR